MVQLMQVTGVKHTHVQFVHSPTRTRVSTQYSIVTEPVSVLVTGASVHNDDPNFTQGLKSIGSLLHVKEHMVSGVTVYSCGDMEGHIGKDGRRYLLGNTYTKGLMPNVTS